MAKFGYDVTLFAVKGGAKDQEVIEGVHIFRILNPCSSFQILNEVRLKSTIDDLIAFGRFDMVHVHDAHMLILGKTLANHWHAKLIYDSHELWDSVFEEHRQLMISKHGPESEETLEFIRKVNQLEQFETEMLLQCDAVISVNESLCNLLQNKVGHRITKCVSIRSMPSYFHCKNPRPQYFHEHFHLDPDTRILLYQGGIHPVRGAPQLLETMHYLTGQNMALVFMGLFMQDYESTFKQQLTNSPQLAKRVYFKEMVIGNEFLKWTASADLGLAPIQNARKSSFYCLPNKLFEYIQAEVPVGVSHFPEMQAVVEEYEVGFTFNPEDPQDIASKIIHHFSSDHQSTQIFHRLQRAKVLLCWETEEIKLLRLYQSLGHQV